MLKVYSKNQEQIEGGEHWTRLLPGNCISTLQQKKQAGTQGKKLPPDELQQTSKIDTPLDILVEYRYNEPGLVVCVSHYSEHPTAKKKLIGLPKNGSLEPKHRRKTQ
jgi:hypothetical protein